MNSIELEKFEQSYQYFDSDYEFLIRFLKWIQIGSASFKDGSCIIDDRDSLGVYECDSTDYFEVRKKRTKNCSQ